MIGSVWNILLELSPWLLLGAAVAGAMHVLLPADWLKRHLSGRLGVLKSVIVGIPLPLCSCSVIPVGLGIRKDGAGDGAAVGFLISTPQTGVDSIIVSGSMLSWPFALFKVIAALVMGLVGGMLTGNGMTRSEDSRVPVSLASTVQGSVGTRMVAAFEHALELIRSIWKWVLAGVVISGIISWAVPADSLSSLPGMSGISGMLLTLLISLPLYVCATASVPIAAALVASGLSPGAAMVFLMAGPATNVATVGAVYRTLGRRALAIYLTTMIAGSLLAGLLFDSVLPATAGSIHHQHGPHTGWLATASAIGLLGLFAWFTYQDARRWQKKRGDQPPDLTLHVTGLVCENCAAGLEKTLQSVDGIDSASVSFENEEVWIFGSAPLDTVTSAIRRKGYESQIVR